MFTGLIQGQGTILAATPHEGGVRLRLQLPDDFPGLAIGDSVAVDGTCLTVVTLTGSEVIMDVSSETLERTTLGRADIVLEGRQVNLEPSLQLSDRLDGHLVTGHVDGMGQVLSRESAGASERWTFAAPSDLMPLLAEKGSVAVDGVSLTINAVAGQSFEVNLIPHSLEVTTLGARQPGDAVNLEADLLARYVARQLA